MPIFYLHFHSGEDVVRDEEGLDFPDLPAAAAAALRDARDVIAADVLAGKPVLLDSYLAIENEAGQEVHRIAFSKAVTFR